MKKISPLVKGAITGGVMVIVASLLHYTNASMNTGLQYLSLFLFAGGIAWTLIDYSKSPEYTGKFGDIFQQGFKCFVIIALVMITYLSIFIKMNPKLKEEHLAEYRKELVKTETSRTPAEIDTMIETARNGYITSMVSTSVFQYLLLGSAVTLAGAGILLIRKKQ
ncbi:DUF4199 family protein [Terrimonas sp. NA20]|uniref:DUF4199 family protein n=1 Tax=Terrimonas ginsenosidimutans TaxID=2908004 RepID=A0ABS9KSH3_9BACT|nr:DUF4199 family protein [Terrimonas ginsenosidimutans]MCG2615269.1 DUF4199 family protein [Terrimonas ginsenosidimutans]